MIIQMQYLFAHSLDGQYCKIIENPKSSPMILRVNLEHNYKIAWTYRGLQLSTESGENVHYPNELTSDMRLELIKKFCTD